MKNNHIRVKSNTSYSHLNNALSRDPHILELYTTVADYVDLKMLKFKIEVIQNNGTKVYIHHPHSDGQFQMNLISSSEERRDLFKDNAMKVLEVCRDMNIKAVLHANYQYDGDYTMPISSSYNKDLYEEIGKLNEHCHEYFLWENSLHGGFTYANESLIDEVIKPLGIRLNNDMSHTFICFNGNMEKTMEVSNRIKDQVDYYHLVDSMGINHDGLELGMGKIDWRQVRELVRDTDCIFEIGLKDLMDITPMIRSGEYYYNL